MLYFRRVLLHLVEIGDDLAEMVRQEAKQAARARAEAAKCQPVPLTPLPQAVPPTSTDAYERITRSMRRCMALYQKLAEPRKTPSPQHRTAARKKIIRDVEDVIQSKAPDDEQEILHAELLERLDRPELDDEIANRSIAEIVTDICRDFGIAALPATHPWKRRIPHDIAILNARAAQLHGQAPSAELAALLATAPPPPPPRTPPIAATDPPADPYRQVSDEDLATLIRGLGTRRES